MKVSCSSYVLITILISAVPTVHFNGSQSMVVRMPADVKYQVEDLIIRFKSPHEYGLLFATTHRSGDYIEIALFAGKIRMLINMGGTAKVRLLITYFNCLIVYFIFN